MAKKKTTKAESAIESANDYMLEGKKPARKPIAKKIDNDLNLKLDDLLNRLKNTESNSPAVAVNHLYRYVAELIELTKKQ